MKINKVEFKGKIGFEIECVYNYRNRPLVEQLCRENNWKIEGDISINRTNTYPIASEIKFHYDLKDLNDNLDKIKKLFLLIKSGKKYNCGGHIHLSFEDFSMYYKLTDFKYVKSFQEKYISVMKGDDLLRVHNHFCKYYDSEDDFMKNVNLQLSKPMGSNPKINRYFSINFNSFNLQYKTIEYRIFNGTNKITHLVRNINLITKTINEYLKEKKEFRVIKEIEAPQKTQPIIIKKVISMNGGNLCAI